jgi:hypothetical protein
METEKEAPEELTREEQIAQLKEFMKERVKRPRKNKTLGKTTLGKAMRNEKKSWATTKSFTAIKKR